MHNKTTLTSNTSTTVGALHIPYIYLFIMARSKVGRTLFLSDRIRLLVAFCMTMGENENMKHNFHMKPVWSEVSFEVFIWNDSFQMKNKKNNLQAKTHLIWKVFHMRKYFIWNRGKDLVQRTSDFMYYCFQMENEESNMKRMTFSTKATLNYVKIAWKMLNSCEITFICLQQLKHDITQKQKVFAKQSAITQNPFLMKTKKERPLCKNEFICKIIQSILLHVIEVSFLIKNNDFIWKKPLPSIFLAALCCCLYWVNVGGSTKNQLNAKISILSWGYQNFNYADLA